MTGDEFEDGPVRDAAAERPRPLIDWAPAIERYIAYHVVAGTVLSDFPGLVDAALFGGEQTSPISNPLAIIVQAALDYFKKHGAAPGSQITDILKARRKQKNLTEYVLNVWDEIEHADHEPYEELKAHLGARCLYRASRQKVLAEAEWLARGDFETIEEWGKASEALEERVQRIRAAGGARLLRLVNAAGYEAPDVAWMIEPLVPMGMLSMIAGKDGMGKSLLAMEMAKCVLTGEKLIGKFTPATTGRVLLLLMDDPDSLIRDRLQVMDLKERTDLDVPQDIDTSNPLALIRYIHKLATDTPYVFIVIDCLYKLLPDRANAQNDAGQMKPLLNALNSLAEKTGSAVVIIHHEKKNEPEIAGSFATRAALKTLLMVSRPKPPGRQRRDEEPEQADETRRVLALKKSKLVPENHWDLKLEGPGKWRFLTAQEERQDRASAIIAAKPDTGRSRALAFFKERLASGAVLNTVALEAEAQLLGHSPKNIKIARGDLGVKVKWIGRKSHLHIPLGDTSARESLADFYRGREKKELLDQMDLLADKVEKELFQ